MPTIAELSEEPTEWLKTLNLSDLDVDDLHLMLSAWDGYQYPEYDELRQLLWRLERNFLQTEVLRSASDEGGSKNRQPVSVERVVNELHDLLCGGRQYEEDRKRFVEQFKVGQAGFATAITTVLVPALGQTAPVVGTCVALSLSLICKVGLRAWCEEQADRRKRNDEIRAQRWNGQ